MTDHPTTPENERALNDPQELEAKKRQKAEVTASLMKPFLHVFDTILPELDEHFLNQMLFDMVDGADRYDSMAIVTPQGWQPEQSERLRIELENLKAILDLITARKKMIKNAQRRHERKATQDHFNRIFGITT